ncbi:MAG: cytochrome P450 [Candidatus Eremiobacteraeota bacterium]|nr:cytochrome P450 [Candidatus Eremiobacteraeota bacterium]
MKQPPGPGDWHTFWLLRRGPLRSFPSVLQTLVARYGDLVAFRVPWRQFYIVNDPELIKEVLVHRQHEFSKSHGIAAMRLLLGEGLLTSEPPLHRQMRRIVQPAFHASRIAGYARQMVDLAQRFETSPDGDTFDMHAAMMELTLGIATTTLFGVDARGAARSVGDSLRKIMEVFPLAIGPLAPIRRRLRLPSTRTFDRERAKLDRIVLELIDERRRQTGDRGDVLSMLLGEDDARVRDEVMTLFLAGHETTANALTWAWCLLAQNPAIAERLRAEADAVVAPNGNITELLARLPFTQRVVRETLRLYPPAWIIAREAKIDIDIGGYRLKRGSSVLMSQLLVHRSPRYYIDPERFDPDRWVDSSVPEFAYFPFGGGARRCIGEQFAWVELTLVLATIARRFAFTLDARTRLETQPIVTLRPKYPIWMRSVAR